MTEGRKLEIFPSKYGFFPYVFLVYLLMPLYFIWAESGIKEFIGYCLLILFLVSYRQLYFSIEVEVSTVWLAIQITIIILLSIFYNINILFLGYFSANFIGWYKDKRKFHIALILFGVSLLIPIAFYMANSTSLSNLLYLIPFLIIMIASPYGIRSMNNKMELEMKLDKANEQIKELVKREERMRIARDLHDTLGHTLSLITLKSQLIAKLALKDPERASAEAKEMERTSRTALAQVRELVSDMRTITVAEEVIESQSILQTAGISFRFNGDTILPVVPHLTQNILSLCLKEAVTNVVKHSHASECSVTIEELEGAVRMTVTDNGKGINDLKKLGNGLKGMEERLELIDGEMQVSSLNGTKLVITIPIIVKESEAGAVS